LTHDASLRTTSACSNPAATISSQNHAERQSRLKANAAMASLS
jgi:hypothetical protein